MTFLGVCIYHTLYLLGVSIYTHYVAHADHQVSDVCHLTRYVCECSPAREAGYHLPHDNLNTIPSREALHHSFTHEKGLHDFDEDGKGLCDCNTHDKGLHYVDEDRQGLFYVDETY